MSHYRVKSVNSLSADGIINACPRYDIILVCVSTESRSQTSLQFLSNAKHGCLKLALLNANDKCDQESKDFYLSRGFELCNSAQECHKRFSAFSADEINTNEISVCIDVSCMQRRNLASILSDLMRSFKSKYHLNLAVVYTLAQYSTPSSFDAQPNARVAPVHPEFAGWASLPSLPIAVIVGLGYEKDKALGAMEYIESNERIVYIPESPELEYKAQVFEHNSRVISATEPKNILHYQVDNPALIFMSLRSLVEGLKNDFRTILFPFGPKIFYAASLLVAVANPEVSVWYVSGEEDETPVDKKSSGKVDTFGMRCHLENIALT